MYDATGRYIQPLHDAYETGKLNQLADDMRQRGWVGRPILAIDCGDYLQAITGSHRIAAAELARIEVEVCEMSQPTFDGEDYETSSLYDILINGDDDDRLVAMVALHNVGMVDDEALASMRGEVEANETEI
ncbi:MAG: ParB N-terminal domain-containing protein [Victivallaceae bacterium]|nr:ParB N-terminal domain-containing protein [Victivallaceae bacterium]